MRLLSSIIYLTVVMLFGCGAAGSEAAALITLNPTLQYQTITGWEATEQSGETECAGFDQFKDEVFDLATEDLGINRIRLEIKSGSENPTDWFTKFINGQITEEEWHARWHEIINDNSDPNVIDLNHFQFSNIDLKIERIILPLQERLARTNKKLFVNLNYVDFDPSDFEHKDYPQEYAEFVLATYQHIQNKYGWVPDAWEVILEPDHSSWSAEQVGNALAAAAARLKANGFQTYFIAPSTLSMGNAVSYFDKIITISGVQPNLKELSYHRYADVSDANLQAIANRVVQYGIRSAMLENIGADYNSLHQDLKIGRNSAWQQFTLAYCTRDNGAQYYWVDNANPADPTVNLGSRTKYLRQYFRYILPGAIRIGASSNEAKFDPLAFKNPDGRHVVVIKATEGGSFQVQGLPAGRYGIYYTTASQYNVLQTGINIQDNQLVTASIPAAGVITVYGVPPSERVESINLPKVTKKKTW